MSANVSDWIGNTRRQGDFISPSLVDRYKAVIGDTGLGHDVPYGLHWCLCLPQASTDSLGADGHPPTGSFLPPSPLPRRMWASSDVAFLAPLKEGDVIERVSTVKDITEKDGRSGKLIFVRVEHMTFSGETEAVKDIQTIVYREATTDKPNLPEPQNHDLSEWEVTETLVPTTPLLFRYSALTFNSHRIHYDLPYAQEQEYYPGLVVHGPLMASLLLRLATSLAQGGRLQAFKFRGLALRPFATNH